MIDPDGTCHDYLGLIVEHATGVIYHQQCGGLENHDRSVEGYYLPLGGVRFHSEEGDLNWRNLAAVFHGADGSCVYGGNSFREYQVFPADRLAILLREIEAVPFWTFTEEGEADERVSLRFDESRFAELVEAWVPVLTPYGRAILTWPNCD